METAAPGCEVLAAVVAGGKMLTSFFVVADVDLTGRVDTLIAQIMTSRLVRVESIEMLLFGPK